MVTLGVLGRSGRLANARQQVKSWPRGLAARVVRTSESEFSPVSPAWRGLTCVAGSMLRKQAKTAKNQMWWENAKLNIITVRVAVAIVGFCNRHSHADHDGVNAFRFCGGHPVSDSTRR